MSLALLFRFTRLFTTKSINSTIWHMKKFLIIGFFWAALALSGVYAQTFTNPVLAGDHPDPTIVRDGEDYYMTHSSMEYQPGLTVWHSRDLVNWEPISYGLKTYLGSLWAPTSASMGIHTTSISPWRPGLVPTMWFGRKVRMVRGAIRSTSISATSILPTWSARTAAGGCS